MGAVSVDIHKKERELENTYELNTAEGVKMLLEDVYKLEERRFLQGDFDASIILIDLKRAVEVAKKQRALADRLTDKQWQSAKLVIVDGYTYEEASELLQVSQSTVYEHTEKCCQKLAKVFSDWNYGCLEGSVA